MVRTVVATSPSALFGTRVSKFLMKCVRQRCHEAPPKTVANRRPEALVGVGGHELHAGESAHHQAAEK